jgi:hypothetical protein
VPTTICAAMLWPGTPQWYPNVPFVAKVCRNDALCPSAPESNAPVSEVTVCEVES